MSWESVKIPDVLFFQEGPGVRNTQFTNHGVKLLNVGNINFGNLNLDATKIYISEEEAYGKYKHFLVDEGDLLIASSGIVVSNFHNKITWACKEHLPLCLNTSTIRFKTLDPNVLDIKYFSYFLKSRLFADQLAKLITGSAQLNFGSSHLKQISLPLPPLATQKRIAEILDAADALRRKDHELLKKYDELAQAIFIDMFGDPVKNEKGWDVKTIKDFGVISTGNTPSRADKANFDSNYIEWIKTDNIVDDNLFVTQSSEYLSEVGSKKGRITPEGSLLVACIAGSIESIGRAALTDRQVAFNQQINSIQPNSNVNGRFLYYLIKFSRKHIQNHASNGMKRMLSKGEFEKIKMILPELKVQNLFIEHIQQFEIQKEQLKDSYIKSVDLFNTLIQKAFNGELVA